MRNKFVVEYKKANGNKLKFIEIMRGKHKHLKDNSILRRFYDCKAIDKKILGGLKGVYQLKYRPEYDVTPNREMFIQLMQQNYDLRTSSLKRYHNILSNLLGEQKPIKKLTTKNKLLTNVANETHKTKKTEVKFVKYTTTVLNKRFDEDKIQQPSGLKLIMWDDFKKYGFSTKNRKYLINYGFTESEINWLIEKGEYIDLRKEV